MKSAVGKKNYTIIIHEKNVFCCTHLEWERKKSRECICGNGTKEGKRNRGGKRSIKISSHYKSLPLMLSLSHFQKIHNCTMSFFLKKTVVDGDGVVSRFSSFFSSFKFQYSIRLYTLFLFVRYTTKICACGSQIYKNLRHIYSDVQIISAAMLFSICTRAFIFFLLKKCI